MENGNIQYDIWREKLLEEYDIRKVKYDSVVEKFNYIISRALERNGIKIHSWPHRFKGFDSFLGKIKRKGFKDPFNEVHDLIGFRIICLFLDDIIRIGQMLEQEFDIFDREDKIESAPYDVFGYMASHYIVKFKKENKESVGTESEKDYIFEIQVRTIAQDAWASISQYLEYKKDDDLPNNLKRSFYALSALFYIADNNYELLRKGYFNFLSGQPALPLEETEEWSFDLT